jgi:hypothetical protein
LEVVTMVAVEVVAVVVILQVMVPQLQEEV